MSDREPIAPFVASFLGIPGIVLGDALNFREMDCNCGEPGCAGIRVLAHFDAHVLNGALVWKRGPHPEAARRVKLVGVDGREKQ
jgi:hypothetical protein